MILVTGATGTVGSRLVEALVDRQAAVRVLVRRESEFARGVEQAVGDFADRASLVRACRGVERVFLLSPAGVDQMIRQQLNLIDAARAASVRHIVKLSSIAADEADAPAIVAAHREIEQAIEDSGVLWTHLRPNWFMQNELGQAESVWRESSFSAPDMGSVSMIEAGDVAAIAAHVLTAGRHHGRAYVLTGPQTLAYGDVAAMYTRVLGRTVRWNRVSFADAYGAMRVGGLSAELASGFVEIMTRYRSGGVTSEVSQSVPQLLGRPATSFATFVARQKDAFESPLATTGRKTSP